MQYYWLGKYTTVIKLCNYFYMLTEKLKTIEENLVVLKNPQIIEKSQFP